MYFQVIINSFSGFGPFCLCFKANEPCTVFDLKQRLAKTTAVSVEEQRIRSLGGRILTDSDNLFQDYSIQEGPIILNLTVRLVGGRTYQRQDNVAATTIRIEKKPLTKKIKLENPVDSCTLVQAKQDPLISTQQLDKGKEKESRKRKL